MDDEQMTGTWSDVLVRATRRLAAAGGASPRLDAEVLLRHLLGIDRTRLFLRLPEPADEATVADLDALIARRIGGEPVAYLAGAREFMGLSFEVGPGVLVPRPETELLVEWAFGWIGRRSPVTIVDIGTGSGAIALSLAELIPDEVDARIVATDVSPDALTIAGRNRSAVVGETGRGRVEFRSGSLADPVIERVDLLVANLPYLTPQQVTGNSDLAAEPRLALDGGDDGLDLVRGLLADLPRVLAPSGAVGLELDPGQCAVVARALADRWPNATIDVIRDLAGLDRHVVMTLPAGG